MSEVLLGFCALFLLLTGLGVWSVASELDNLAEEIRRQAKK